MKFPKPTPTTQPANPTIQDETINPDIRAELEAGRTIKVWYNNHTGRFKASCGVGRGVVSGGSIDEVWENIVKKPGGSHYKENGKIDPEI